MENPVVEVETSIRAVPMNVWKAMTAKQTSMFPGTNVDTDWKVGHPITFTGAWNGKKFKDKGEIKTCEAPKELAFTHWSEMSEEPDRPENYHLVRFTLKPMGKETNVTLSQFNRGKAEVSAQSKAELKKNWQMMLDGLKKSVEAG